MKHSASLFQLSLTALVIMLMSCCSSCAKPSSSTPPPEQEIAITLPEPQYDSNVSLEQSLFQRRSTRSYTGEPLTLQEVSQLLWAAQGITDPRGFRTAPSAGALYPLEVYVVAGDVENLTSGVYRYEPARHGLIKVMDGDIRTDLSVAALAQSCVSEGAAVFVFTAVYQRTTFKYGERGTRYVHIEVGHAGQNIYLQATALGLGTVAIGAFHDESVRAALRLDKSYRPLYIMPVGKPA